MKTFFFRELKHIDQSHIQIKHFENDFSIGFELSLQKMFKSFFLAYMNAMALLNWRTRGDEFSLVLYKTTDLKSNSKTQLCIK